MSDPKPKTPGLSRRGFLKGTGLSVAATSLVGAAQDAVREEAGLPTADKLAQDATHPIQFTLNSETVKAEVKTGHTLLETLRDQLDQTGTKLVCDMGSCGACTVHLDGVATNSCLLLAVEVDGRKVDTIEGLAKDGQLHPVQEAFIAEDALQCGFCTPGMLMSCKALLDRNPKPSRAQVADAISGNICRCGTYENIFRAMDRCTGQGGR